jgi:hypothetical protein
MTLFARKKYPDVIVRRGNIDLGKINLQKIPDQVQEGKLLDSDRISLNGHTWFRLDKFPELKHIQSTEKSIFDTDISELLKKKYPDVIVRRGMEELGTINLKKIPDKIQEGKFLGSDRISINGDAWYRLDKLPELKYFFLNKRIEEIQIRRAKMIQAAKILTPVALTLLVAVGIYLLPYLTYYRIMDAIENNDTHTLVELIDQKSLNRSKRTQGPANAGATNPRGTLESVPSSITAEGLRSLIELGHWQHLMDAERKKAVPVAHGLPRFRKDEIFLRSRLRYTSPTTFSITIHPLIANQPPIEMTLTRSLIGWKLTYLSILD